MSILAILFLVSSTAYAQPKKPVIDTLNVGWGWFELSLSNTDAGIRNTQWIVLDAGDTAVFDSRRTLPCIYDNCEIIKSYSADTRDLTHKRIIGCSAGQTLRARARYNLGNDNWSEYSNTIEFRLPDEPVRTADTVRVILWGQSHLRWGDECMKAWQFISPYVDNNRYADGYELSENYENDTYGHALQTELRRIIPGVPVVLLNYGKSGSMLDSGWLHHNTSDPILNVSNITMYDPGQMFGDTKKFPIAVFFHSNNDEYAISATRYAQVVDSAIHRLTDLGVKVVFNSVHYSSPFQDCYAGHSDSIQQEFFDAWDRQLNQDVAKYPGKVWKGADLFHLLKADTARFWAVDGQHPNTSEGVDAIVSLVAPIIRNAILATTDVSSTDDPNIEFYTTSNDGTASKFLEYRIPAGMNATLELYDVNGAAVSSMQSNSMITGSGRIDLQREHLNTGLYFGVLKCGTHMVVKKVLVVGAK